MHPCAKNPKPYAHTDMIANLRKIRNPTISVTVFLKIICDL